MEKRLILETVEGVTRRGFIKNERKQRGITLVALIVTIVILLILAGITIMYTMENKGIWRQAEKAKNDFSEAAAREELEILLTNLRVEKIFNSEYNQYEYIDNYLQKKQIDVDGDNVTVKGWNFKIDRSVPKISQIEDMGEKVFTFGEKSEEYDGISGESEEFIVPYTGYYRLEVWGAQGGTGGKGGYSSEYVRLTKGEKLYIYIGGKGADRRDNINTYLKGGFNGGGNSGIPSYHTPMGRHGAALRFRRWSNRYKKNKGFRRKLV